MKLDEYVRQFILLDEMQDDLCTDKNAIQAALESINEHLKKKFDSYIKVYHKMAERETAIDAEIRRLKERKKEVSENKKGILDSIIAAMRATGIEKIESDFYTAQVRVSAPSVVIDAEDEVPDEYKKINVTYQIDKNALKRYLKDVGGETDYAHLEVGYSLSIK